MALLVGNVFTLAYSYFPASHSSGDYYCNSHRMHLPSVNFQQPTNHPTLPLVKTPPVLTGTPFANKGPACWATKSFAVFSKVSRENSACITFNRLLGCVPDSALKIISVPYHNVRLVSHKRTVLSSAFLGNTGNIDFVQNYKSDTLRAKTRSQKSFIVVHWTKVT